MAWKEIDGGMEWIDNTRFYCLDSDKIPTIHYSSEDVKCSFRIDKPEWVNSLEGEKKLSVKEVEEIIERLKEDMEFCEFPGNTQYDLCRKIWNLNHWDMEVPKMEMPDYTLMVA